MSSSIRLGLLALAVLCCAAIFLIAAYGSAPQSAQASNGSIRVSRVESKVSGGHLYVSAKVRVPRAGRLMARVRLDGKLLCHSRRKVVGAGYYGIKCVITRGALAVRRHQWSGFDGSGTAGATFKINFEDYAGAWLGSIIPLPPLPPIPLPPPLPD